MKMLQVSLVLLFLASVHQSVAVELITNDPLSLVCSQSNYTTNSTYHHNLQSLFRSLSSNISGFATAAVGQGSDQVYGIALCRGDLSAAECQNCTADAAAMIQQMCLNSKSSTIWRLLCELRYSSSNFTGTVDTQFFYLNNVNNETDAVFNRQMRVLLQNLSATAAANSSSMFASGQIQYTDVRVIHGAVQCTRDLSSANCMNCLDNAVAYLPACCPQRQGAVVFGATCSIRYELYPFLRGSAVGVQLPSPSVPPPTTGSKKTSAAVIVAAVIASLVLCLLICGLILWRRKSKKTSQTPVKREMEVEDPELLTFNLDTLRAATSDFSEANKLGEGGYGPVYKGTIDDREIAVKRLSNNSGQGSLEFKNEVRLIAKLQHRNLVRLLGSCMEDQEKILVYEFVPNNSLGSLLFDPVKRLQLDWATRVKIITGIARGLLYLHEDSRLKIIHRDLKPSNVLLDNEMNPKISDFGMAKICGMDETHGNTRRIAGTYGYMSPEYVINGNYSLKSDVFSFGVLLLEIVSGRKNTSFNVEEDGARDLLNYAWNLSQEDRLLEVVDKALGESYSTHEALRCIHIGLLCVQEDLMCRPTISTVVLLLGTASVTLPPLHPPAFFVGSRSRRRAVDLADSREEVQTTSSSTAVTVTELEAR